MYKMEVFFDYACPYCYKGHEYLKELVPDFPQIQMIWCPCESHPRPDSYGSHSDLCIQGMYYCLEENVNIWDYHDMMYRAAILEHINIEDPRILSDYMNDLLNSEAYYQILVDGIYKNKLKDANQYAFHHSGVWAVPSYRSNKLKLDSIEDVGITKTQLKNFMQQICTI